MNTDTLLAILGIVVVIVFVIGPIAMEIMDPWNNT